MRDITEAALMTHFDRWVHAFAAMQCGRLEHFAPDTEQADPLIK